VQKQNKKGKEKEKFSKMPETQQRRGFQGFLRAFCGEI